MEINVNFMLLKIYKAYDEHNREGIQIELWECAFDGYPTTIKWIQHATRNVIFNTVMVMLTECRSAFVNDKLALLAELASIENLTSKIYEC